MWERFLFLVLGVLVFRRFFRIVVGVWCGVVFFVIVGSLVCMGSGSYGVLSCYLIGFGV